MLGVSRLLIWTKPNVCRLMNTIIIHFPINNHFPLPFCYLEYVLKSRCRDHWYSRRGSQPAPDNRLCVLYPNAFQESHSRNGAQWPGTIFGEGLSRVVDVAPETVLAGDDRIPKSFPAIRAQPNDLLDWFDTLVSKLPGYSDTNREPLGTELKVFGNFQP